MQTFNACKMARLLLSERLLTAKLVVDATAGNGKDTLYLAEGIPESSRVVAFDVQDVSLERTRRLLIEHGLLHKTNLIQDSHAQISCYFEKDAVVDAAVFNLGYLPGADHAVTTQADSTVEALTWLLNHLNIGGMIAITAYRGHPQGEEEEHAVRLLLSSLPAGLFTVGCWSMMNHQAQSPILYFTEKVRGESGEGVTARKN